MKFGGKTRPPKVRRSSKDPLNQRYLYLVSLKIYMNFNISWGLDHIFVRVPISDALLGRQVTDFLPTKPNQLPPIGSYKGLSTVQHVAEGSRVEGGSPG